MKTTTSADRADIIEAGISVSLTRPCLGVTVCTVAGNVDMSTAGPFGRGLGESLRSTGSVVVVDLSRVNFFGLAGVKVLLKATEHASQIPKLRLVTATRCVDRVLEVAGVSALFDSYPCLDAALAVTSVRCQ